MVDRFIDIRNRWVKKSSTTYYTIAKYTLTIIFVEVLVILLLNSLSNYAASQIQINASYIWFWHFVAYLADIDAIYWVGLTLFVFIVVSIVEIVKSKNAVTPPSQEQNNIDINQDNQAPVTIGNGNTIINILNPPQSNQPPKDILKSLPIPPNPHQPLYILRAIDSDIHDIIQAQIHRLLIVHAQGGYGKTTLIQNLLERYPTIPMVVINKQNQEDTNLVDLLFGSEFSTMQNTPHLIALKERYIDGTIHEIELLDALQKDFASYGVFIVDTFEKLKGVDISSYVQFSKTQIERRKEVRHIRLKDCIELLFGRLLSRATFMVVGRNDKREIGFELDDRFLDELTIEGFSTVHIQEYFRLSRIPLPSPEMINQIHTLTRANALLVSLIPEIVKDYDSGWDELDIEEMKRRMERDEENGLLFYLANRILSHIDQNIQLYPLIVPRILHRDIAKLLYGDTKVLARLVESGLAHQGKGRENELYYLHDSVALAIYADTKREYQESHSSYHDHLQIAALHQKMIKFYQNHPNLYNIHREFEICYHTMMLKKNFENEFAIDRGEFIELLLGSFEFNSQTKLTKCQSFDTLPKDELQNLIEKLRDEKKYFLDFMSQNLYNEFAKYTANGKNDSGIYNIKFTG